MALVRLVAFLLFLLALAVCTLIWVVHTNSGTRLAWQTATHFLNPKLSGTLDGGTLQNGVRLRNVVWRDAGAEIRIDRLAGRWDLRHAPWQFTIAYLRIGTVDVHPGPPQPARPSQDIAVPHALVSPLRIDIRDVKVEKIAIHDGRSTTDITGLALHGGSDGRHHRVVLDSVATPYGTLRANVTMDGVAPFAMTGGAQFVGDVGQQPVTVNATLTGALQRLALDVQASGMKLAAVAHVDAKPFDPVPLQRLTIQADHIDPQVLSAGAPKADLAIRADLQPVAHAKQLTVAGLISVVNAIPGALDAQRLPLADAVASVRLDAHTQAIPSLHVHLLRDATITGQGSVTQGKGQLTLDIAKLDLHALHAMLRPTDLKGRIALGLDGTTQSVNAQLDDSRGALAVHAAVTVTPAQTRFDNVQLTIGRGRAQFAGALKRDSNASFAFKGDLRDFDPLSLTAQQQKAGKRIAARVSGTFDANGTLTPEIRAKIGFALADSVYDGLPMTGRGTLQLAGTRLLPSQAQLSVAGNQVSLNGSFGAPRDRLAFVIDAQQLARLGFGFSGQLSAKGYVSGSIAHPEVSAQYQAHQVVAGSIHIGQASGKAELHDGANGALNASMEASDVSAPGLSLQTLSAQVEGTRAKHTIQANARGTLRGNTLDAVIAAQGGLSESRAGMGWQGTISQLQNRGTPAVQLGAPVSVVLAPQHIELSATRMTVEGATLDLRSLVYQNGQIRSAGKVGAIDVARMLTLASELSGKPSSTVTDLVIDGDWDFALGSTATGYLALRRHSGDLQVNVGQGTAGLGLEKLAARVDFAEGNRARLTFDAQAARLGALSANLTTTLTADNGILLPSDASALSGTVTGSVPSLRTTGGLLGPAYLLDGSMALKLALSGTLGKPKLSGQLSGEKLAAAMLDQGVQLRDGVIDVKITDNVVDFRNVEFHGSKGVLRATGQVELDADNPNVTAKIVADKLELFGAPDRQLSVSGQATLRNGEAGGGLAIDGKFIVDRALFDLPTSSAPRLGDDVVIVRSDGHTDRASSPIPKPPAEKPVGPFTPRANITIDLGKDFSFHGAGAVLGLAGALTVSSAPNMPLSAIGNVSVKPGSTYEAFGRKLNIETGFFTFNGPIDNPSINLLAMRRNQEVEAGVRVRGTLSKPDAQLVSEPSVPDDEKLSWLLFGHGTDTGQNLGQQNTMAAALALVGSAGGKRIAQTVGLDEFTIGTSDNGLTDAQVVSVAKALNEHFVLGYEQGLQSAGYLFKLTWLLSRRWSVAAQAGTFNGLSLLFTERFD